MIVQLNEFILPSSLMEKGTRCQSFAFVPPKRCHPATLGATAAEKTSDGGI